MPTQDELEAARRRRDDVVSYRDMVDFVAKSVEDFHRARAETLIQLEKRLVDQASLTRTELVSTRTAISSDLLAIRAALDEHARWHRDQLAGTVSRSPSMRIAAVSLVFTALTTVGALVALVLTHWR